MEGKSYFMLSPVFSLDQDDTNTAIEKLQIFVNRYPNSEFTSEAIELIEQLQNKIEKKEFEISKQYYTIRDYNSAIKSLDNFIADIQELFFVRRHYTIDGYLLTKLLLIV